MHAAPDALPYQLDRSLLRWCVCANADQPSQKSFRTKIALAKAARQNRSIPNWFRLKTDNKIHYNARRRHWRRTKLNI